MKTGQIKLRYLALAGGLLFGLLLGCRPSLPSPLDTQIAPSPTATAAVLDKLPVAITPTLSIAQAKLPPATPTALPTSIHTPTPVATATATPTNTATPTPTATPIGPCSERILSGGLLDIITLEYGLSRRYAPSQLVPLAGRLSNDVTLGYPTLVRDIILEPLVQMINDMQAAALQPMIISGYRSYSAQSMAWNKWLEKEPERASILSAPPGYSEHQLGTTIDFGSPELPEIVDQEDVQFHTHFYMTSESRWLVENAHRYGFTLSYPREAFELTGFYYEPWHYRYIGVELATQLKESEAFLTQYQLDTQPIPCIP
jgi:D-alanyl-D-alanine carboxypeptidase